MTLPKQIVGPAVKGSGLALITLVALAPFPEQMVIEFAAILLAIIAAIYIGFALSDERESVKRVEIGAAVLFTFIALAGLWINPWLLIAGYVGHGVWDWLHHVDYLQVDVAAWYPPLCAVYDLVVGFGLLYWIL